MRRAVSLLLAIVAMLVPAASAIAAPMRDAARVELGAENRVKAILPSGVVEAEGHTLFLQRDPNGYQDSVNQYAYGANDPINHRDPTGKETPDEFSKRVLSNPTAPGRLAMHAERAVGKVAGVGVVGGVALYSGAVVLNTVAGVGTAAWSSFAAAQPATAATIATWAGRAARAAKAANFLLAGAFVKNDQDANLVAPALAAGGEIVATAAAANDLAVAATAKEIGAELEANALRLGGTDLVGDDPKLAEYAARVPVETEGYFNVVTHADSESAALYRDGRWISVSHRQLAAMIRKSPGYAGQPVRLLGCSAGACSNGLAQNLANQLGVSVQASTQEVYLLEGGGAWTPGSIVEFSPRTAGK